MAGRWRLVEHKARWLLDSRNDGDDWWNHHISATIEENLVHGGMADLLNCVPATKDRIDFSWDVYAEAWCDCPYTLKRHGHADTRTEADAEVVVALHEIGDMRLHYAAEQKEIAERREMNRQDNERRVKEGERDA